jgi:hypothetical protein
MSSDRTLRVFRSAVNQHQVTACALLDACSSATDVEQRTKAYEALSTLVGQVSGTIMYRRDMGDEFQSDRDRQPRRSKRLSNAMVNECIQIAREHIANGTLNNLKTLLGLNSISSTPPSILPSGRTFNEELSILLVSDLKLS